MSDDTIIIRKILRSRTDYYAVLGVPRTANLDEIKRSYRKRALLLHPDKNTTSEATEAFKIVNTAYATLSDPAKRTVFDNHGSEGVQRHESGQRAAPVRRHFHHQQINVEDIFTAFFGGGVHGVPQQRRDPHARPHANPNNDDEANVGLLMVLPFIMFLLLAFTLSSSILDINTNVSPGSSSHWGSHRRSSNSQSNNGIPPFSLRYSSEYIDKRRTTTTQYGDIHAVYYVKSDFSSKMRNGMVNMPMLELAVLSKYKDYLSKRCQSERMKREESMVNKAEDICQEARKYARVPTSQYASG